MNTIETMSHSLSQLVLQLKEGEIQKAEEYLASIIAARPKTPEAPKKKSPRVAAIKKERAPKSE